MKSKIQNPRLPDGQGSPEFLRRSAPQDDRNVRSVLDFVLGALNFLSRASAKGFTIIELLIALSLFSILVVGTIGITIQLMQAQLKAANIQAVIDNIRFSMELLAREMRTGLDFDNATVYGNPCGGYISGSELTFKSFNQGPAQWRVYYLRDADGDGNGDTIMRIATQNLVQAIDCANAERLTSEEIIVEDLAFAVWGIAPGADDGQPRVTISLNLRSRDNSVRNQTSMKLQTSIAQRVRDIR